MANFGLSDRVCNYRHYRNRGSRGVVLPTIDKLSSRAEFDMISAGSGANRLPTTHLAGQLRLDLVNPSLVE